MVDYYNLVAVPRDAPLEAIRRAFRARAKAVHPDAHPHLPAREREALRRRVRRSGAAGRPEEADIEAELRRLKRKLGRSRS